MKSKRIGLKYGRLTVTGTVRVVSKSGSRATAYTCKCECGNETIVHTSNLAQGATRSCGCLAREARYTNNRKHGMSDSREYDIWKAMKSRCYSKKSQKYIDYGGRGIKVCDRWLEDFKNFYSDMGECPEGCSIDRIDVNGDYSPDNCRWASAKVQARNRRNNVYITAVHKGRKLTLTSMEWSEITGLKVDTIYARKKYYGYSDQECIAPLK